MSKINFTVEHDKELKELFVKLSFAEEALEGKFGANNYTPSTLLYTASITTLQTLHKEIKKSVESLEDLDEWSATPYQVQKANRLKNWARFINLLIGYKKYQAQLASEDAKNRSEKARKLAVLKQLKDEAEIKKLGELSVEQLQAQIEELEK